MERDGTCGVYLPKTHYTTEKPEQERYTDTVRGLHYRRRCRENSGSHHTIYNQKGGREKPKFSICSPNRHQPQALSHIDQKVLDYTDLQE